MSENKLMPAATGTTKWRDPQKYPPPRGVKLLLLTTGSVAVIGDWRDDSNLIKWAPLPKKEDLHE